MLVSEHSALGLGSATNCKLSVKEEIRGARSLGFFRSVQEKMPNRCSRSKFGL